MYVCVCTCTFTVRTYNHGTAQYQDWLYNLEISIRIFAILNSEIVFNQTLLSGFQSCGHLTLPGSYCAEHSYSIVLLICAGAYVLYFKLLQVY